MARIAVVGGGISGLAAAHLLAKGGHDIVLLDDRRTPGGLIASERKGGFLLERGPQAILDGAAETKALFASAGLADRVLPAGPSSRRRFVYVGGTLRPFPASPPALLKTNLFSARGKLRLFREPFVPPGGPEHESVLDFVTRRFGEEAAVRAAAPALIGVYAGDAAELDMAAALPRLKAMEREHGSILRALARGRKQGGMGHAVSFPDGVAELPAALAATLGDRRREGHATGLAPRPGSGWRIELERGEPIEADQVVLAIPAAPAASLLAPVAPDAAAAIGRVPHAPVAVVHLGFSSAQGLGMDLDNYGFVVARGEGIRTLGCQLESSVFPGRAPEGGALVRVLLGGTFDRALVDADDAVLAGQAVADLRRAAGLARDPDLVEVWRAIPGIPQYDREHRARLAVLDRAVADRPGLTVLGQAFRGVGIVDCIRAATAAAAAIGPAERRA